MTFDTIIRHGRLFDGTEAPSRVCNVGIKDGRIAVITSSDIDDADCPRVLDATEAWVVPGFIDIHTHYDVEVLKGPGLAESVMG